MNVIENRPCERDKIEWMKAIFVKVERREFNICWYGYGMYYISDEDHMLNSTVEGDMIWKNWKQIDYFQFNHICMKTHIITQNCGFEFFNFIVR